MTDAAYNLVQAMTAQPGYIYMAVIGAALTVTGICAQVSQYRAAKRGEAGIVALAATSHLAAPTAAVRLSDDELDAQFANAQEGFREALKEWPLALSQAIEHEVERRVTSRISEAHASAA